MSDAQRRTEALRCRVQLREASAACTPREEGLPSVDLTQELETIIRDEHGASGTPPRRRPDGATDEEFAELRLLRQRQANSGGHPVGDSDEESQPAEWDSADLQDYRDWIASGRPDVIVRGRPGSGMWDHPWVVYITDDSASVGTEQEPPITIEAACAVDGAAGSDEAHPCIPPMPAMTAEVLAQLDTVLPPPVAAMPRPPTVTGATRATRPAPPLGGITRLAIDLLPTVDAEKSTADTLRAAKRVRLSSHEGGRGDICGAGVAHDSRTVHPTMAAGTDPGQAVQCANDDGAPPDPTLECGSGGTTANLSGTLSTDASVGANSSAVGEVHHRGVKRTHDASGPTNGAKKSRDASIQTSDAGVTVAAARLERLRQRVIARQQARRNTTNDRHGVGLVIGSAVRSDGITLTAHREHAMEGDKCDGANSVAANNGGAHGDVGAESFNFALELSHIIDEHPGVQHDVGDGTAMAHNSNSGQTATRAIDTTADITADATVVDVVYAAYDSPGEGDGDASMVMATPRDGDGAGVAELVTNQDDGDADLVTCVDEAVHATASMGGADSSDDGASATVSNVGHDSAAPLKRPRLSVPSWLTTVSHDSTTTTTTGANRASSAAGNPSSGT